MLIIDIIHYLLHQQDLLMLPSLHPYHFIHQFRALSKPIDISGHEGLVDSVLFGQLSLHFILN